MAKLVLFKITKSATDVERVYRWTFFPCVCGGWGQGGSIPME